mmetsp:Transcript_71880/g.222030  ORF Transcript_71880/g.222030 Transcript_71880/m.222030 type:complete len:203 (+) Transcript_71880:542-1150(+)
MGPEQPEQEGAVLLQLVSSELQCRGVFFHRCSHKLLVRAHRLRGEAQRVPALPDGCVDNLPVPAELLGDILQGLALLPDGGQGDLPVAAELLRQMPQGQSPLGDHSERCGSLGVLQSTFGVRHRDAHYLSVLPQLRRDELQGPTVDANGEEHERTVHAERRGCIPHGPAVVCHCLQHHAGICAEVLGRVLQAPAVPAHSVDD